MELDIEYKELENQYNYAHHMYLELLKKYEFDEYNDYILNSYNNNIEDYPFENITLDDLQVLDCCYYDLIKRYLKLLRKYEIDEYNKIQ